jgi:hypothetical protein
MTNSQIAETNKDGPGTGKDGVAMPRAPKPKVPWTFGQKMWLLLAIPIYLLWGFVEAHWAGADLFALEE